MPFTDYYKVLELPKTATADDVKKAYRKLARKFHPDLNPNDKEANRRFQQLNEANEVLSDPEKKKKYDQYSGQYGENWEKAEQFEQSRGSGAAGRRQPGGGAGFGGVGGDFTGDFGESGYSDFFESLFGGGGRGGRTAKGQDFNAELHLSLREAATSHSQTLSVNGKNIRISIPAGVENGQVIKLKGHGAPGPRNAAAGDLFLTFVIAPDPQFKRTGNDLQQTVNLDLYAAVLGGEVTVDTLDGKIKLKVKPGTQNGAISRLKGKGFPVYKKEGSNGDLYITFNILIPTSLSAREKELFEALSKEK